MQIYDSYLLKALDVKLPYSEEQAGSNGFKSKMMEKLKLETHPKLRKKSCFTKNTHHTQPALPKFATKNHKSFVVTTSSPVEMEATCCQDEEPVFLRCGQQICVWVSKSHRCAGAGATPWCSVQK